MMFRHVLLTGALLTALPADRNSENGPVIRPGFWSYSASTVLPGGSQGRQCVPLDKIEEFISGPHNKHYRCVYPSRTLAAGRALFNGVCTGKHGEQYKITVAGAYTLTSFDLSGSIRGRVLLGIPISLPISIHARWIGPSCPAPSDAPSPNR
jgi:hypothetical protein